jgi:hypothetical protein
MELRGKKAALCAYAKGDTCSLSIVASELNCKQKLQIQLVLEYLSIHDPLPLELTKPRLFPYISYLSLLDGSLSYVPKYVTHTYESHPILFEPSFSSALFENYADKTNPTQSGTVMSIMSMIFVAFSKTQISTHSHM